MPLLEAPLNTANQHAANADDYLAQGLFIPAAEEHQKAADAYTAAVERCTDEQTKRTLRMLHEDHLKAGKELQRKIAKLREENIDPTVPQKPPAPTAVPPPHSPFHINVSQPNTKYNTRAVPSPPPSGRRMTDSQGIGDESFMVLGQRSDPGDAFNHFWKIMEGMLENLSQPVAFATAPLPNTAEYPPTPSIQLQRNGSLSSDTDIDEPIMKRFQSKKNDSDGKNGNIVKKTGMSIVDLGEEEFEDDIFEEGDEMAESFCLVPPSSTTTSTTTTTTTMTLLKKENTSLKADMEAMRKRMAATERILQLRKDQDQQLRDSIYMARREAQRAMGSSGLLSLPRPGDFGPLSVKIPCASTGPNVNANSGIGREREAQLVRRVRELEEEVRVLRVDSDKQKAMIGKFRERWDKLKESAKRKKDAKALVSVTAPGLREPAISEEHEEEQPQDWEGGG